MDGSKFGWMWSDGCMHGESVFLANKLELGVEQDTDLLV